MHKHGPFVRDKGSIGSSFGFQPLERSAMHTVVVNMRRNIKAIQTSITLLNMPLPPAKTKDSPRTVRRYTPRKSSPLVCYYTPREKYIYLLK
jgi:hypothetical protein